MAQSPQTFSKLSRGGLCGRKQSSGNSERWLSKAEPKEDRSKGFKLPSQSVSKTRCEIFQIIPGVEPVARWLVVPTIQMEHYQDFATLSVLSALGPRFSFVKLFKADPRHHTFHLPMLRDASQIIWTFFLPDGGVTIPPVTLKFFGTSSNS